MIALGVPTIVDSATLAIDAMHDAGMWDFDEDALRREAKGLIVTPKEIDRLASLCAKLIAGAINLALHDGLTLDALDTLTGT